MAHNKIKLSGNHRVAKTYREDEFNTAPKYAFMNLSKTMKGTEYMAIFIFDALVTPGMIVSAVTEYDGKITRTVIHKHDEKGNDLKPSKVIQITLNHRFVNLNEEQIMLQIFNILVDDLITNGSVEGPTGKDEFLSLGSGFRIFQSNIWTKDKFRNAAVMKLTKDGEEAEKEYDALWIMEQYTELFENMKKESK